MPGLLIGIAALGYGIYTAWARNAKPEQFWKLEPMKRAYGEKGGLIVHMIGYTVVPIVLGLIMIVLAFQGKTILDVR